MKVQGPGELKPDVRKIKKARSGDDSGVFASLLGTEGTEETSSASLTQSISQSMLSLQEVTPETHQRHLKRGYGMLEHLDRLRNGILMGAVSRGQLAALQQLLSEKKEAFTDPKLQAILQEIEVRAAVELAKLDNTL